MRTADVSLAEGQPGKLIRASPAGGAFMFPIAKRQCFLKKVGFPGSQTNQVFHGCSPAQTKMEFKVEERTGAST
jgi:hypothetical protein